MSTYTPQMQELWEAIHKVNPKAKMGGSAVGKAAYLAGGGPTHTYHLSANEIPVDDGYTVHYFGDRRSKIRGAWRNDSCAIDITFHDAAEMHRVYKALYHAAMAGKLKGVREIAGTLDGKNVVALDLSRPLRKGGPFRTYGWDDSHLWHIHIGFNRRWSRVRSVILNPALVACFKAAK